MSSNNGQFAWCELMTVDTASATQFYRSVVGWNARDAGMPDRTYTVLQANDVPVGGVMELPEPVRASGGRPGWITYVAVDDAEAASKHVQSAGGAVHRPAEDIPGIGRFAVVADPQGAVFTLFQPGGNGLPPILPPSTPGHVGWHELHARDWPSAYEFYAGMFGWTKGTAVDMGPMGTYQLFDIDGVSAGGMMSHVGGAPGPFWLCYFSVSELGAAVARVRSAGGTVLNGPHQVPGGSWIAHCVDPQGAMFALTSMVA